MLIGLFRSLRRKDVAGLNAAAIAEWQRNDLAAAERLFRQAVDANPGLPHAWSNLGQVLWEQRRYDEGLECLRRAVGADPGSAAAHANLANAQLRASQLAPAVASFREALWLDPRLAGVRASFIKALLDLCEWEEAGAQAAALHDQWRADARVAGQVPPFLSLVVPFPPEFRLAVARGNAAVLAAKVAGLPKPAGPGAAGTPGRLRVGYLSADLHDHAIGRAAVRLFECHDRDRVETFAYRLDADDGSALRGRIAAAFDHVADVQREPFHATAQRIATDRIDVLVDLMGYTGLARPEVLALQPAPAQVAYLGYAGTTGADYIGHVVADDVVLPAADERWYTERPLRLAGGCFFPASDARPLPAALDRAAFGVPAVAVVFCSFGAAHKIEAAVFATWMRILRRVPGSVLWLTASPAEPRLRRAAAAAGVDPERLVFARRVPSEADYLGRLRLADLFLDTRTYNGHSTTADALWAGVPVLTVDGGAFAGRVAASLLRAAGLPELATPDLAAYEEAAVALAAEPGRLARLRGHLDAGRAASPLFDPRSYARGLEAAYLALAGARPS
jgi:predicted O-linked N-acetylglucosamine transferase (SPINDLY family)